MLFAAADGHHEPHHEIQDHEKVWPLFEFLFKEPVGIPLFYSETPINLFGYDWYPKVTKFMILELIAAALIIAIYVPLARKIRSGELPKGRFWNFFEFLLVFIRDDVARPNLDRPKHDHADHIHGNHGTVHDDAHQTPHGHGLPEAATPPQLAAARGEYHEGDQYVPFLWTLFLFVLFCNLLGMFPTMGSPTASIWVTGGLALITFFLLHAVVIAKYGVVAYLKSLWPVLEMPPGLVFKVMGFGISLLLAGIEFMGGIIKSGVLAVRLFANMFAGHLVLATILFFIYTVGTTSGVGILWGGVTIASILGVVALSLLELFVGFLQAYIFTFLTALFLGMALQHAEHH